MQSCFGNYVMQKAIEISQGAERLMLVNSCKVYTDKIKDPKIKAKWENIIEQAAMSNEQSL